MPSNQYPLITIETHQSNATLNIVPSDPSTKEGDSDIGNNTDDSADGLDPFQEEEEEDPATAYSSSENDVELELPPEPGQAEQAEFISNNKTLLATLTRSDDSACLYSAILAHTGLRPAPLSTCIIHPRL